MVFDEYARCYDMFYRDKPYAGEARYVADLIREQAPGAQRVLNLGCGTGRHDRELVKLGFDVTGVDQSEKMVELARGKIDDHGSHLTYECGDMRSWRGGNFDAVVSLFHVMSYQTTDEDVRASMRTVADSLRPGGVCVFDFWFAPGVVADPPVVRSREASEGGWKATRLSTPEFAPERNVVAVHFDIDLHGPDGQESSLSEVHEMRYFFGPELEKMAQDIGLDILELSRWMSRSQPTDKDWNAVMVLRKR